MKALGLTGIILKGRFPHHGSLLKNHYTLIKGKVTKNLIPISSPALAIINVGKRKERGSVVVPVFNMSPQSLYSYPGSATDSLCSLGQAI